MPKRRQQAPSRRLREGISRLNHEQHAANRPVEEGSGADAGGQAEEDRHLALADLEPE